ncbi:MAG: magnesium transporter [Patescibacteria group bacterium]|nr:magnesium transporter [Patescibacteria group bacterium]
MPYISHLLGKKIFDSSDSMVGVLEDVLISPKNGSFSPLEYLMVKTRPEKLVKFVPYVYVDNFTDSGISLKSLFKSIALNAVPEGNYIYLRKEVLDRQIVDVSGTRVVRVNDLRIGNFENRTCVLAIDSSFRGILRRLGLTDTFLARPFKVNLIDWRYAQLVDGKGGLQLNTLAEHLRELHPADLANIVEELDIKQGSGLLSALDERAAAKVLEELDTDLQNILMKYLGPEKAGKILAQMSSDEIVDLIKTFSSDEARHYLNQVEGRKAESLKQLAEYPDNTAGGLMTLDFVAVRPESTAAQALDEVRRQSPTFRSIFFVYVTNAEGWFEGVISLRRLMVAPPETKVSRLAKNFRSPAVLKPTDKTSKIIQLMTRYNLYTAAVVDRHNKLLGVVTIDDVMRQLYPAA